MANFENAYALTMKAEGGYVNDPLDPGGETYKGIARKYNPLWAGWKVIDAIKQTKPAGLNAALNASVQLQEAIRHFYEVNYWDINRTGEINDQQLANQVFDTAVNCGTGTAARFLQKAAGVPADGKVGPLTLQAVNTAVPKTIYDNFLEQRKQYYLDIIARKPSQQRFQASWFSRLWPYQALA